jgi:hypothetical protein
MSGNNKIPTVLTNKISINLKLKFIQEKNQKTNKKFKTLKYLNFPKKLLKMAKLNSKKSR